MKKLFLLILCMSITTLLKAQGISVSGIVSDIDSNEPLVGATIVEVGTHNGTVTEFATKEQPNNDSALKILCIIYNVIRL